MCTLRNKFVDCNTKWHMGKIINYAFHQIQSDYDHSKFRFKQNLIKHIEAEHEGKKPYKCPTCSDTFASKQNLKVHVESVHEGIKLHLCSICDANFETKKQLHKHILEVHEEVKVFSCKTCSASFTSQQKLDHHNSTRHAEYLICLLNISQKLKVHQIFVNMDFLSRLDF